MDLSEHESRLMNYKLEESPLAKLIYEGVPAFKGMPEAQDYIAILKKQMTIMHVE
jgi:hypothetical protein